MIIFAGLFVITENARCQPQVIEGIGFPASISNFFANTEGEFVIGFFFGDVALIGGHYAQIVEDVGFSVPIARFPVEQQGFPLML